MLELRSGCGSYEQEPAPEALRRLPDKPRREAGSEGAGRQDQDLALSGMPNPPPT